MIETILEFEEGLKLKPYIDSEGYPTIGIGTKIGPKGADISLYLIEITEQIAKLLMQKRMNNKRNRLMKLNWFMSLNAARQEIIISMSYQMGIHGVLKFGEMIKAAAAGDYEKMADEALDSIWARKQSPARAKRHAEVLRTGKLLPEYV